MMVSGWALRDRPQGAADVAFRALARTVSDSIRTPDFSFGAMMSIIACMIVGMPAITMTLPSLKPGARMVALWISSAPSGMRAIRSRASFKSCSLQRSRNRATTSG